MITSVVVGTAATKVAEGLGFSDSQSALLGSIAGVAAGGYVGNQAMAPQATAAQETASVGQDLSKAVTKPLQGAGESSGPMTPIGRDPSEMVGSEGYGGYSPTPEPGRGMLSQASPTAAPPAKTNVSSQLVQQSAAPEQKPTFLERVFTPERLGDMGAAAIGEVGQYMLDKEEREYPRKNIERDRRTWTDSQWGGYNATLDNPYK